MKFEVWTTADGLFHWQRVDDDGKVATPQNSYKKAIWCNNALAKQKEFYPDAAIVRVEVPTQLKGD